MNQVSLLFVILNALYLILFTIPAKAQAIRSFTIIPPSIRQTIDPGESTEGIIKFINASDEILTFSVSTSDFAVTDNMGTPNFNLQTQMFKKFQASSWIKVNPPIFTLNSHQQQELKYSFQVPKDARPGGHYAAVLYSPASSGSPKTGTSVQTKIGTLFYINVKGLINEQSVVTNFSVNKLQEYGPVKILTTIKNLGDLHIRPSGTIAVSNMLGKKEYQTISEYNIFPESSRDYENSFGQKFMFGRFKATLLAYYGKNNNLALKATAYFWIIPWKVILIITLSAIAILLGTVYLILNFD